MTEAEKQTIEKLHNGKKMDLISIIRTFKREGIENFVVTKKETVDTVLNLIEKQQAEIKDYGEEYNHWAHKAVTRAIELEKKDKIIDEMAKTIYDYASLEVVINCPAEFEGRYNMDLCKMNAKDRNCIICIKEYFKKKVEEI